MSSDIFEMIVLAAAAVSIVLEIVILLREPRIKQDELEENVEEELRKQLEDTKVTLYNMINSLNSNNMEAFKALQASMADSQRTSAEFQKYQIAELQRSMRELREENNRKLEEIKGTVDEKLQTTLEKRISESFKTVSDQLEQVYRGLGEMRTLAADVGGLKKVLSGVKTRGILGEVQLAAILEEILAPEQYDTNVATKPGSSDRVEFAVKLPGDGAPVYLPIDSKFPGERYAQLLQAQETGDKAQVDAAYRALETVIKKEAQDILEKYISVPDTTGFAIMFLPFEGLYAEVCNMGLVEVLQRDYSVNIAGPSTMAAYLNSLQMGFRTLAIQKRSSEVWKVLGAVKSEFDNFESVMTKMQTHLRMTSDDLDKLAGTRTRAIMRKLKEVETLDLSDADRILDLPESEEEGF